MNFLFILLQEAEAAQEASGAQGGGTQFWIMIIAIFAIMYFLMIRPQRKRQKEIENFRRSLQVGQDVVTSGGIYGKIKEIQDNAILMEIAHNVVVKMDKTAVFADSTSAQQQTQTK